MTSYEDKIRNPGLTSTLSSYEQRVANPGFRSNTFENRTRNIDTSLIDFGYLDNNPDDKEIFWTYYLSNKNIFDEKMRIDPVFEMKFYECFSSYLNRRGR